MPEQDVLNPFINPLGDKTAATPTTPAAVAPRREWNLYDFGQTVKNSAANIRQNYTLDSAVADFATRNPNFAVGLPSLTVQEANKEFGLSLTGNPNEKVTRRWAENQVKKKEAQEYYQQVSADNPNNNLAAGLVAGVATTLTSPLEVLLNIGTAGAVGFAAKSLMAAKALRQGSIAFKVGQAIAKPGVVREVTEAVVSSGISTTATALQAQQQDAAVFGPDGYGAQQAVFDTATSAGAALVLTALGKGIGKGLQASQATLSKVVDPQRAGAEIANAAKVGVAPNPANAIDIPKVEQQLTVQNTNIEAHLKILEDAEKSLGLPEEGRQEILSSEALRESVALEEGAPVPKNENVRITHPDQPIFKPKSLKNKVVVEGTAFGSPLDTRTVTSQFGRRHGRQHRGVDYGAPMGTPIKSSRGGVVRKVGNQPNGAGKYVEIDHGGGWVTKYFHMSKIDVTEGQKVKAGFAIGGVGNTGRSTGPHLHFEVWKDGKAVDPEMWLNKKTAIAEAAPASRDVPPVKFDDDAPVHLHPEDEVALYSKNMPEFSENAKTTTSKLMDDIANTVTIDPAEASPAVFRGQYEELAERMNVLAEYTGTVIDAPAVTRAFSEGGENARKLIAAVQKAPDAALPVITKILDDARSVLKMVEIRKAKELSTKLENGTIKSTDTIAALQATVAKELPLVLTAHRILEGMGQGRVTEELPLRYFMQMFGDNVSDFGKAVLGEIDASDNRPLYRLRRQAIGRAAKETTELSKLLGEAKKNQGVIERLSLADTEAMALTKQVDEQLAKSPASFEDTVAVAKQAIDERFKMYQESGLFDDASVRQLEGIRKDAQRGIDEGNFAELSKGGDKTDIVETTLRNNKEYTAALEKIKDILTVCASRGLGRG